MSTKVLSAMTAAVLSAAGAVAVTPSPAQAIDPGTVLSIASFAYKAYGAIQRFNGAPTELEVATAQIIDAVHQTQAALVNEIDAVAAATVEACKDSALADVENLATMSSTALENYASKATDCVTLAKNFIDTFGDLSVVDQVGFALNTVAPMALLARARQGSTSTVLKQQIIAANQSIVSRLSPVCTSFRHSDRNGPWWDMACTAFNGFRATFTVFQAPNDFTTLTTWTMRSTAHELSSGLLPIITDTQHVGPIRQTTLPSPTCVDVANGGTANGTEVRPLACNGGAAQQWTYNADGNTIRALGKCLDVAGGATASGTPVQLWDCNGGGAQRWLRAGTNELVNPQSGMCLDATRGVGVHLQIAYCLGYGNQQWTTPV